VAIIDPQDELAYSNEEQIVSTDQLETPEVTQEQPQEEPEQDNLPSKYKGKTVDEIIRMHQEAEKLIGRQAQEVGEVRKLADELIKRQLNTKVEEPTTVKEEEIDFFEDPKKFVSKAVETHPVVQEARNQALEIKKMQTLNRLKSQFPDLEETVTDPSFAEWVKASPIRVQMYATAESTMDYDTAAELLTNWNYVKPRATQPAAKPVNPEIKQAQQAAVKSATVDVGSGSAAPTSAKIYRRADLIRLNLEDPDRYEALQDEILAAYREGRVR
jgi:hypothetical protein